MRRLALAGILVASFAVPAAAGPYQVGTGGGGAATGGTAGFEVGVVDNFIQEHVPPAPEYGSSFSDKLPGKVSSQLSQSARYTPLKWYAGGNATGLTLKSGYTWGKFTLLIGGGASCAPKELVGHDGNSEILHAQKDRIDTYPPLSTSALYRIGDLTLSLGFNNRRGALAGLGFTW